MKPKTAPTCRTEGCAHSCASWVTTLLMMKQGYEFIQYVSFENVIESSKDEYYRVLMDGQQNRYKDNERISPWVLFFMQSLITLTESGWMPNMKPTAS